MEFSYSKQMADKEKPLFLNNKDWYTYDAENDSYTLTENAPPEVRMNFFENAMFPVCTGE